MKAHLHCLAIVGTCALLAGCDVKSSTTNVNEPSDDSAAPPEGAENPAGTSPEGTDAPSDTPGAIPEDGTPRSGLEPPTTPSEPASTDKATSGPGKSDSAPGHDPAGPGNSENAPGHNKDPKAQAKGQGKAGNKPTVDTDKEGGTSASGKTPGGAKK